MIVLIGKAWKPEYGIIQEGRVISNEQMKAEIAYFFQMIKTANPDAAVRLDNKLQAAAESLLVFPMKWDSFNLT